MCIGEQSLVAQWRNSDELTWEAILDGPCCTEKLQEMIRLARNPGEVNDLVNGSPRRQSTNSTDSDLEAQADMLLGFGTAKEAFEEESMAPEDLVLASDHLQEEELLIW
ncbi:hypothetical protein GC174_15165 [bacterium]|nr:hypothetical protein [bacterium]